MLSNTLILFVLLIVYDSDQNNNAMLKVFIFEEKYVNFDNTKSVLGMIIRTIGGIALFFILDTVLKLPFSSEFLTSGTIVSLLIRTLRYAIVSFYL